MDVSNKISLSALVISSLFAFVTIVMTIINNYKNKKRKEKISSLDDSIAISNQKIVSLNEKIVSLNEKQLEIEKTNSELYSNYLKLAEKQEQNTTDIMDFVKNYCDSFNQMKNMEGKIDESIQINLVNIKKINIKKTNIKGSDLDLITGLNMLELKRKRMRKK